MSVGKMAVEINSDESGALRSLDRVSQKMQAVGEKMQVFGRKMTTMVTLPIAGAFAGMAKSAMDLEATEAKFNTVFGNMTEETDAFLDKFRELTPATKAESRNMASGLQDLMIPMGIVREEATAMTGEFMHVAGALANFNSGTHSAEDVTNALQSAITGQYMPLKRLGIQLDKTAIQTIALESGMADSKEEITKAMETQILLDQVYAQSGDALNAYTEENLDAKTKLLLFKSEVIDMAQTFGAQLLPGLNDVIDKLRGLTERFANLTPETKALIMKIMAVAAAIGPTIMIVGKLTSMFGFMLSPIGAVIAILAVAGFAFMELWKTSETFRNIMTNAFQTVRDKAIEIFTKIKDFVLQFIADFQAFWAKYGEDIVTSTRDKFQNIYSTIQNFMTLVSLRVERVMLSLQELFAVVWAIIQQIWQTHGDKIVSIITTTFGVIKNIIDTTLAVINDIVQAFTALFSGDWETFWTEIKSIFKRIWDLIVEIVPTLLENFKKAFEMGVEMLKTVGKHIMEGLWEGLKMIWTKVANWVEEKIGWLGDKIKFWEKESSRIDNDDPRFSGSTGIGGRGSTPGQVTEMTRQQYGEENLNAFATEQGVDLDVAAGMLNSPNYTINNTINAKTTVDEDEMDNIMNEVSHRTVFEMGI